MRMLFAFVSSTLRWAPCWILSSDLSRFIHLGVNKFGRITWKERKLPVKGIWLSSFVPLRVPGQSDGQMGRCYSSLVVALSSRLNSKGQAFALLRRWYGQVNKRHQLQEERTLSACLFHPVPVCTRGDLMNIRRSRCVFILAIPSHSFTLSPCPLSVSPSLALKCSPCWESWQSCIFPFCSWCRRWLLYWHLSMLIHSKRTSQCFTQCSN